MLSIMLIAGAACLIGWIYLLLGHAGFWKVWEMGASQSSTQGVDGLVAAVIPARDEALVIGETVQSLLNQSYRGFLRIIVVDDHSSDGTADAATRAARNLDASEMVTVIPGAALPPGWTGKLWAVHQGVEFAMRLEPQFLLFTDADIHHGRDNVATLVSQANAEEYDLASFMVKLQCESLAERLLIPAFVFFFFLLYPPRRIRERRSKVAGAAGGCILIRTEALAAAGGVSAIRSEIIDDCALANAVKRSGGRVWLGVTSDTSSTRSYRSFVEIERMISRTAFNQLQHSALLLTGAIFGLSIMFLLPFGMLLAHSVQARVLGASCWLLITIAYAPMVRFYRLSLWWAVTLPLGAVFYMTATVHSAWKYWTGRGGEWKGRSQDIAA